MSDVALRKKGEFEIVWLSRGELMLGGDGAASTECFAHARRMSTNRATTMVHIGGLYLRYGHYGQALSALREASRELPHASWVWYQLGRAQTGVGDYEQARISFGEAHKLNPGNETYETAVREPPRRAQGWLQRLFGRFR
jgi:Flp pilus assembly protein TadD